jgi:hypothetical protein
MHNNISVSHYNICGFAENLGNKFLE